MASKWITPLQRSKIVARDECICCYCLVECIVQNSRMQNIDYNRTATLDHIVPQKELAAAATDDKHFGQLRRDPRNLVVACMGCNSRKQHTPLYVWCQQQGLDYSDILVRIADRISRAV